MTAACMTTSSANRSATYLRGNLPNTERLLGQRYTNQVFGIPVSEKVEKICPKLSYFALRMSSSEIGKACDNYELVT